MKTTGVVRRTVGFVLAAIVLLGAGYWAAWTPSIAKLIEGMGGIFPLILAVIALLITALAIFWPSQWKKYEWMRRVSILVALVVAWFGRDALSAIWSSGWSLLLLLGTVIVITLLWLLTAYDVFGKLAGRKDR